MNAPERIWAWPSMRENDLLSGMWRNWDALIASDAVTYIRADHVDTLLKAEREKALREAAEVCTNVIKNYDVMEPGKPDQFANLKTQKAAKGMVSLARQDIEALISEDATDG